MTQSITHVAMTVPRTTFTPEFRDALARFYGEVFGWHENPELSIDGERMFIKLPQPRQYLNVRASDAPMATSGYEHLGVEVDTADEVARLHATISARRDTLEGLELDDAVKVTYGGQVHTFRFRYLMPLAIEVQYLALGPATG